jgi:hypothetical protein
MILHDLAENAPPQIDRRKHLRMRQQHFGFAQKQDAILAESKMEARQDAALRFAVEVHQRVAADQQADARNRRVPESSRGVRK